MKSPSPKMPRRGKPANPGPNPVGPASTADVQGAQMGQPTDGLKGALAELARPHFQRSLVSGGSSGGKPVPGKNV